MAPGGRPAHRTGRDPAVLWSLAGHGLLVVLVVLGGFSLQRSTPPSQLAIKATVVESRPGGRPAPPKPPPKPAPEPEPAPEPAPPPEPPPPDPARERRAERAKAETRTAEQAKADQAKAEQAKAEKAKAEKAKAEQARAEQAKADKAKADQAKAEKAKAEQEAADQAAAEAKKQKEQQAKAEREKAAKAAAARDLERQLKEEERLLAATDSGALADYVAVIRQKVERNWVRPPGARPGLECEVLVTQIPGGEVTGVQIGRCNADDAVRRSIEAAVLRASPLPLPDDAALFERNLRFTFKPEQ